MTKRNAHVDEAAQARWPNIDAAIFDLDGTVYRGEERIPGAFETLHALRERGVQLAFITNNATKSRAEFAHKLTTMGFETDERFVVNSAYATADLLTARYPMGSAVNVVGAPALIAEIERAGFTVTEQDPVAVVVGLDRAFTYAKLRQGVRAILAGADLVATNPDRLLPVDAAFDPGAGTLLAAFRAATDTVTEPIIVGKPERRLVDMAVRVVGAVPERTILVGDQLDTDVRAGQSAGLFSVLVTTGVPVRARSGVVADRVISRLTDIPLPRHVAR